MNQNFNNYEKIRFKCWIKKRFIHEVDICNLSYINVLLWSEALQELSSELVDTWCLARSYHHEIVPFQRSSGR
ncbi:hypothetical protein NIES267_55040 [Calothrix parasitica NIES-267]|uniref:Uncharacterized protein n=1 Tax=Calothrix parasitica NIES-267 TaxID=1973488 RepID=A0A1Z4LY19_9CYAN|nr:hypothetical protein NIES267_55040 [Calothrix parasitica NIES-267]